LAGLDRVANLGLRALLDIAGVEAGTTPSARQVAFQIAPRINAAGRMASAGDIVDLFTTTDPARARTIASQLDDLNKDRRTTEDGIQQAILEQCLAQPVTDGDAALVFAGEGWHRGVVGIVASRVVERFHRPAFVLGLDQGVAYGSGRSIRAFHLLDALESMPALFTKFGGHRQAAGVTLLASQVDEFRVQFRAYAAARLTVVDFQAEIEIDAEIAFEEITDQTVRELLDLAPFGCGNAAPTLMACAVEVAALPEIKNEKHVFLRLKSQGRVFRAKAWNFAERASEFAPGTRLDVAFQFEEDAYSAARGYASWQMVVQDVRPAMRQ
jgi:single-stranded-DNA-specific exonuclease